MKKQAMLAMALVACAGAAAAQGVYRCGNSYSQQPCDGAQPVQAAAQGPTAEQQAQARANARRDAKLGNDMEKERIRQEARPVAAYIPAPKAAPKAPPQPQAKGRPGKKDSRANQPDYFTATAVTPAAKKTKKKDS